MEKRGRIGYPSDVSDEEWAFVAPYLALCREGSEQREYSLRAVFNGLRYIVRSGGQWRFMPNDLPPWTVVYQQTQRWIRARCFEIMVEDLRMLSREFSGCKAPPTAVILDSRTLQSTPESGARASYDGVKRCNGSKVHAAVDTLGHLLALHVTLADEQDRAQVGELAGQVQQITEENVELAYVDQGYGRDAAEQAVAEHGIQLEVVTHTQAKRGFMLVPRRWVVEKLRQGCRLPPSGSRLRKTRRNRRGVPLPRLRLSHDRPTLLAARMKLITGSRGRTSLRTNSKNRYG
jgi:transposase